MDIRVEFHGYMVGLGGTYGASTIGSPDDPGHIDVTSWVSALSWMHSVSAPWETLSLTLNVPFESWSIILPGAMTGADDGQYYRTPSPGFWVVVRVPPYEGKGAAAEGTAKEDVYEVDSPGWPAIAWGRCSNIGTNISAEGGDSQQPQGHVQSLKLNIQCESWLSLLNKSRIVLTSNKLYGVYEGFYEEITEFLRRTKEVLETVMQHPPGFMFNEFWKKVPSIVLPNTLGSSATADSSTPKPLVIKEVIPLVHDRDSCRYFAPMRCPQQLRVPGEIMPSMGQLLPRGTIWQWLSSSFQSDARVIELFPSLEFPVEAPFEDVQGFNYWKFFEDAIPGSVNESGVTIPADGSMGEDPPSGVAEKMTALGKALGGAQPVLMYRLRPFLLGAINEKMGSQIRRQAAMYDPTIRDADYWRLAERKPVAQKIAEDTGRVTTYGQEPIDPTDFCNTGWQTFTRQEIFSMDINWNDEQRTNGVYLKTPWQPASQMEMYGLLGFPVIYNQDLEKHGMRMYDVDWPFLNLTDFGELTDGSVHAKVTAMCDVLFPLLSCYDEGGFFGSGSINVQYRPWLKAGNWVWGELPAHRWVPPGDLILGDRPIPTPKAIEDPGPFKDAEIPEAPGWSAYLEGVTHSISVGQRGEITVRTSLQVSRFTWRGSSIFSIQFPLRQAVLTDKAFRITADGKVEWGDLVDGEFLVDETYDPVEEEEE